MRQDTEGVNKLEVQVLPRMYWQKTYRCRGDTDESCEECRPEEAMLGGYKDCWGFSRENLERGAKDFRRVGGQRVIATSSTWKRFVTVVHVRCHGHTLQSVLAMKLIRFGTLRLYWDGTEIHAIMLKGKRSDANGIEVVSTSAAKGIQEIPMIYDGTSSDIQLRKRESHMTITMKSEGAHELAIEFVPNYSREGSTSADEDKETEDQLPTAVINALYFYMEPGFAKCEDTKVCLLTLGTTKEGRQLRNSNELQALCLSLRDSESLEEKMPEKKLRKACTQWQACLKKEGTYRHRLVELMEAAGVHALKNAEKLNAEKLNPFGQLLAPAHNQSGGHHCMYPPTEDVESWTCDCYSDMLRRCRAVREEGLISGDFSKITCLRAQFC
eukprot:CAMPEP_0180794410 /NCGR_PEP_ID=MMETSP1038_2-20121128/55595_1 /TAXON_ID=632150 /ORGANISM="Azadinium spinosum, Strain 3D9" /LENGTH=383 /DNA_ID=CAMNT_0022833149 /DNA_START=204 /DNA_END=1351 /DNA_ORIENTATION=+